MGGHSPCTPRVAVGQTRGMEGGGRGGECAGTPPHTSRMQRPCLWKKVDLGSRLRERGRSRGRPRGSGGLTPAGPGTCTAAGPGGRDFALPGQRCRRAQRPPHPRAPRVRDRRAAATRADGARGSPAMPGRGAGRGRGRRAAPSAVCAPVAGERRRGARGAARSLPPRRGAPLCSRGRRGAGRERPTDTRVAQPGGAGCLDALQSRLAPSRVSPSARVPLCVCALGVGWWGFF